MDKNKIAVSTYNKIADRYTEEYFNDLSDIPFIDKFLSFLKKDAEILDIGCGPGTIVRYLMDKGYKILGIDLSSEMLRIAKKKVPKGKFKFMDMQKLAFPQESFDGLISAYSLIHIPSKQIPATLKGFYKVLKPNGVILIAAQKGKADQLVDEPFKPSEKMFFNFFSKKRLIEYLEKTGFKILWHKEQKTNDPNAMTDINIYIIAKKRQK